MRTVPLWILALLLTAPLPGQLRREVSAADHVLVAHRAIDGTYETVTVLHGSTPTVPLPAPVVKSGPDPDRDRLLCLVERRGELKITADVPASPSTVELATTLLASERGRASARTAGDLVRIVLGGDHLARREACRVLHERAVLRDAVGQIGRETMLLAAVGETEDIAFKESLATLCAEAGQRNVVEALCISLQSIPDPEVARAVGRIAGRIHGEAAVDVLRPFLRQARGAVEERLRLAIEAASARSEGGAGGAGGAGHPRS